uniref:Uncharacterized protein n=1 Tax=Buteo japonicus TaxID=224669 RepID=A0A8C0BUB2_9AVES
MQINSLHCKKLNSALEQNKPKFCSLFSFPVIHSETSHHGKFPPEQCPSEWIGYKNKCYFISEEEKNWTSSQTFCAENESLLAQILKWRKPQ